MNPVRAYTSAGTRNQRIDAFNRVASHLRRIGNAPNVTIHPMFLAQIQSVAMEMGCPVGLVASTLWSEWCESFYLTDEGDGPKSAEALRLSIRRMVVGIIGEPTP